MSSFAFSAAFVLRARVFTATAASPLPDSASRAKATSFIDSKRRSRFFSSACSSRRTTAGGAASAAICGGSSLRMAFIVSMLLSRRNGCTPLSISYSTTPKAKTSER